MEGTFVLILLVVVMLVGSYLVGSIPLVMPMSEVKFKDREVLHKVCAFVNTIYQSTLR
jgi:hypothetical protein